MRRHVLHVTLGSVLAVLSVTAPAYAQAGYGVRAGVSADPDQFFFGGHLETRPLLDNLTFRPNLELGVGDDVTTVAMNLELAYWIPVRNQPFRLYVGGGPAANIYARDGDDDVAGGFNIMFGIQHTRGLFGELKVGTIDSPEIKFTIGYAFK